MRTDVEGLGDVPNNSKAHQNLLFDSSLCGAFLPVGNPDPIHALFFHMWKKHPKADISFK